MLPPELLKVIFGALSRDDLDALMLTSALFHDMVIRSFAKEPLRYFATLKIAQYESSEFGLNTGNYYYCKDNDDFSRRMRLARVGGLMLDIDLNENLFDILLPHKDTWRNGYVQSPFSFKAPSLFERAFRELLFCESMFVITAVDGELSQPFLSLPAVRECTSLQIFSPPRPLTTSEILEWLKVDARSKEPKWFEVYQDELRNGVENLVEHLKTVGVESNEDFFIGLNLMSLHGAVPASMQNNPKTRVFQEFVESKRARRYVVRVIVDAHDGQSCRYVNKDTSEELIVRQGTDDCGINYLEVERKSRDEKQ